MNGNERSLRATLGHVRSRHGVVSNFNENEDRFVPGEDFIDLTSDEIRTMSSMGAFPPHPASVPGPVRAGGCARIMGC